MTPLGKGIPSHLPPLFNFLKKLLEIALTQTTLGQKNAHKFVDAPLVQTTLPPAVTFCYTFLYPLPLIADVVYGRTRNPYIIIIKQYP